MTLNPIRSFHKQAQPLKLKLGTWNENHRTVPQVTRIQSDRINRSEGFEPRLDNVAAARVNNAKSLGWHMGLLRTHHCVPISPRPPMVARILLDPEK